MILVENKTLVSTTSTDFQKVDISNYKKLIVRVTFPNAGYIEEEYDVQSVIMVGSIKKLLQNGLPHTGNYFGICTVTISTNGTQLSDIVKGSSVGNVSYNVFGLS